MTRRYTHQVNQKNVYISHRCISDINSLLNMIDTNNITYNILHSENTFQSNVTILFLTFLFFFMLGGFFGIFTSTGWTFTSLLS